MDFENVVVFGRDKSIRDCKGILVSFFFKVMKIYEKMYFIYLLCDVCIFLVFLIRIFEREDVDLFMIEFRVLVINIILRKMEKDVFFIS